MDVIGCCIAGCGCFLLGATCGVKCCEDEGMLDDFEKIMIIFEVFFLSFDKKEFIIISHFEAQYTKKHC